MIQPVRVVPSNAPPLRSGGDSSSRVLQEHSCISQQTANPYAAIGYVAGHEQKYSASLLTENIYPTQDLHGQLVYPQHHRPSIQSSRCGTQYENGANHLTAEEEAHIQHDAKVLWRQFLCSDGYAKYRQRQHKDGNKKDEQKWPDELEKAFFHALVRWQPMGRRKYMWKAKLRGRNELIADYIEAVTGIGRTRKQVSSHIQVLKPFVAEDPRIMRYLSKDDIGPRERHGSSSYLRGQSDGRQRSNYPVIAAPPSSRLVLPHPSSRRNGDHEDDTEIFQPFEFEMFVQRKYRSSSYGADEEDEVERLHTYTKHISQPLISDQRFSGWEAFAQEHPFLATMHSQRPIATEVIAAEASLAMTNGTWSSKGVELGISFRCRSTRLPPTSTVMCSSLFCIDGQPFDDPNPTSRVNFNTIRQEPGVYEAQVNFGSSFWVRALSAGYREAGDAGAAYLKSITATQEISLVRPDRRQEKLLLIHWSFRKSSGTCGRAFWRRLILPSPSKQYEQHTKTEAVDTLFNFSDMNDPLPTLTAPTAPPQPALQSPFEYDSSAGSALSSATWPSAIGDANGLGVDTDFRVDNNFDFFGGNINIDYDSNIMLDNFDTTAFNFDGTGDDFVADPNLEDYSQQTWADSYAGGLDAQQSFFPDASFDVSLPAGTQAEAFPDYGVFDPQMYVPGQEAQAFGGAGHDGIKDEDALAALADANLGTQSMSQQS